MSQQVKDINKNKNLLPSNAATANDNSKKSQKKDGKQTNAAISFLIVGIKSIGKTSILNKICGAPKKEEDGKPKYEFKFSNCQFNFTELNALGTATSSYMAEKSDFQMATVVVIVYSRTNNHSYEFAKELYNIICDKYQNIYFIETFAEYNDRLKRIEDFEEKIDNLVFSCSPLKDSKDELLSIFYYIYFSYQNEIYSPTINVYFPKHEVRNLVATSDEMGRTFILTCNSIKMHSFDSNLQENLSINFQFSKDFTFYHPISLITNYNGTKLILITAFKFYLIDNKNSNFDPSSYFLPDVHRITPKELYNQKIDNKQVIDVIFLPKLQNYFAIVFPDKIQIYKITETEELISFVYEKKVFDNKEFIKMCRFRPIFKDMLTTDLLSIYILSSKGTIYSFAYQSKDRQVININTIHESINSNSLNFKLKKGDKMSLSLDSSNFHYLEKQEQKFELRYTSKSDNTNKPYESIIVYGFEFIRNELIVYGQASKDQLLPTFFHCELKSSKATLKYVDPNNEYLKIDVVEGLYRINEDLFVKSKDGLHVFEFDNDKLLVHKVIESSNIVGFTNSPFSCIITPGYIVSLSYYFTRVNPVLTYKKEAKEILDEYLRFSKERDSFYKQIKIDDITKKSAKIKNDTKLLEKNQNEILVRAIKIKEELEKLENEVRIFFNQFDELQPIQRMINNNPQLIPTENPELDMSQT